MTVSLPAQSSPPSLRPQANAAAFQSAFGETVFFSLTYPTPPTPPTSTLPPATADEDDTSDDFDAALVAGVTAASAVVALLLVTVLAIGLYFWWVM